MTTDRDDNPADWCQPGGTVGQLRRPITEDWLRDHGWRIEDNRNDPRLPVRRLVIGRDLIKQGIFHSSDDLCIDVAPVVGEGNWWFVWLMQVEPYRHIHVRMMRQTWELARLYEGLTGRVWPGTL